MTVRAGQYPWPSLAEVNTRARRYISAWLKQQRKDELKQAHLLKVSQLAALTLCTVHLHDLGNYQLCMHGYILISTVHV